MQRSITRIEIKNFQSHSDTVLHLVKGINLITGTSDAGKSAILRALLWVLTNKPRGDSFVKTGSSFASVKLVYDDSSEILRFKGTEENFVQITRQDGTVDPRYEKFGHDYSEKVREFLAVPRPSDVIGNIFYAGQWDPLFLLGLSSTDLPRAIGYLAGSDIMELASNSLMSDTRRAKRDNTKLKAEVKKLKADLKQYDGLDDLEQAVVGAKGQRDSLLSIHAGIDVMSVTYTKFLENQGQLAAARVKVMALDSKTALSDEVLIARDLFRSMTDAEGFLAEVYRQRSKLAESKERLQGLMKFFKGFKKSEITALTTMLQNCYSEQEQYGAYIREYAASAVRAKEAEQIDKNIKQLQERATAAWGVLKDSGMLCQACGQLVKA